jgi:hypothetical protein
MSLERHIQLAREAAALLDKFVEVWRQELAEKGFDVKRLGTVPERALLEIIHQRMGLRHSENVVRRLFAEFGPESKRTEAKRRRDFLASLYGDNGKPPKKQFAREAAEYNEKAKRLSPRGYLLGGGATRTESMLQYVNRMLRDKECKEIVESAFAESIFGERRPPGKGVRGV